MDTQISRTTISELDDLSMIAAKGKGLANALMLAVQSKESVVPIETLELTLYDIFDKFVLLEKGIDSVTL